jgi:hypothetical protein
MSLQDDFFDVEEKLKGTPEAKAFARIWFAYCDYETFEMHIEGKMSAKEYYKWRKNQMKELGLTR